FNKIKSKTKRFRWLARNMTLEEKKAIEKLDIKGLGFLEEPKRVYPNNQLLSQVIGFTGREGFGLEGLERTLDDILTGSSKKIIVPRDARGRPLLNDARLLFDVSDGKDVILTIDREIQYFLERELQHAVDAHDAESAVGIILDAKTSEILAMANTPGYDLNQALQYSSKIRRNKVVMDAFEPGSTMKTFVVAAGLTHKIFKPSTKFDCEGGRLKIGKRWITEADAKHDFQMLTVTEILAKSSNVGSAKLGFAITDKTLYEFLKTMGFGEKPDVMIPGATSGILQALPWNKHLLSNISFGHGISTSALQIANGYAAVANGGFLNIPKIIRGIKDPQSGEVTPFEVPEGQRVISESIASTLTLMLTQATSDEGTGAAARVAGYPVAGKTGTAQKVDPIKGGYFKNKYISSFAGFAPAHKPQFVIYIAVDDPKENYYGSEVAAPVFSKVASFLLRRSGVAPVLISDKNVIDNTQAHVQNKALESIKKLLKHESSEVMPDIIGESLRDAVNKLRGRVAEVQIKGSGQVVKVSPDVGASLNPDQKVIIELK
ncbi:MAG: PASTA domain-containing protein, partial [Bdellovibrionales bacterium]|nr:PASTA domain-containing protein [Bdellovibrionales bacterium]